MCNIPVDIWCDKCRNCPEHCMNILWTSYERSENTLWIFNEYSMNIQWTSWEHPENILRPFNEHLRTFRVASCSVNNQAFQPSSPASSIGRACDFYMFIGFRRMFIECSIRVPYLEITRFGVRPPGRAVDSNRRGWSSLSLSFLVAFLSFFSIFYYIS